MPPKFKPRQRKHKVLARQSNPERNGPDPNIVEHIPLTKSEVEERKQRLKEELLREGQKVSGKKAKRLEKYIDTKLKKDENRALIAQLAKSQTDTSLFASSKKLGQGKETKRERLGRALGEKEKGIDLDGDNDEILFERRIVRDLKSADEEFQDEDNVETIEPPTISPEPPKPIIQSAVATGIGLKRPLELDEDGKPVLKKRKRTGGIKSKLSLKQPEEEVDELPWQGFSSSSEIESNKDEDSRSIRGDSESEPPDSSEEGDNTSSLRSENVSDNDEESDDSSKGSEENDDTPQQKRSSVFKFWANQQLNEALGYQPLPNQSVAHTPAIAGFRPRAPEQDPLPRELQQTTNTGRKAFSVNVDRSPIIQEARLQLPVVAEEQKIMEAVHNNSLIVLCGATGSGKTTQVPQFLYEAGYGSPNSPNPGMIGITQPRRVAAVSMAQRVGVEMGDETKLNHEKKVGYQIRFDGTVAESTAIKFMTDGVLLREIGKDKSRALRNYSAIIIDEAHERSVNTDILIGMLSRIVKFREILAAEDDSIKPLKLIIMSATIKLDDFTKNRKLFEIQPPILTAEGRQFPVTNHFARRTHHDYIEDAFRKIERGHKKLPAGGMLVFLTGQSEITQLGNRLKDAFKIGRTSSEQVRISDDVPLEVDDVDFGTSLLIGNDDYEDDDDEDANSGSDDDDDFVIEGDEDSAGSGKPYILPLYSMLSNKEQLRVFEPPPDGTRLIVLATNVAETSLTIPGIRYVFDCGRSKELAYDQATGVQSYEISWISKASADQRAGRAGRTGPGHCYRLYSSAVYERDFPQYAEPEILRSPIEGVMLQLKAMKLPVDVVDFPFPTPPDRQSMANAEKLLKYLHAVSLNGKITNQGIWMSNFPLAPRFARILEIGHHLFECLPYTIAVVAALSVPNVFIPENQLVPGAEEDGTMLDDNADVKRRFNAIHKEFCSLSDKSDAMKLLKVVAEFSKHPTEKWCREHFVNFKTLSEISKLRRQLTSLYQKRSSKFAIMPYSEKIEKLPSTANPDQVTALREMITGGFIDHIAIRADLAPNSLYKRPESGRAIQVPYLTLIPSHLRGDDEDKAVYIHPTSPLAHLSPKNCPRYIVYSHLQRATASVPGKISKTRMHALTDIEGNKIARLAKDTPLLTYGKPDVSGMIEAGETMRKCWVIPYLRAEGTGGVGWPLPVRKVKQRKDPVRGWVVEEFI